MTCMPVFNTHRELKNGRSYDRLANNKLTETSGSKTTDLQKAHSGNTDSECEARILAQEEVDEQIKTYIAPLTK